MKLPKMMRIRQTFDTPTLDDVAAETRDQLAKLALSDRVQPGQTVAVTVGSRGVANIASITREIVRHLEGHGAVPFIVPAMGSHGGATSEGQRNLIEGFGVTEEFVGAPIRSSMETVIIDKTPQGIPVHFDKHAFEADHVFVAGRIKPHTMFVGDIESGLHKMMLIGLGKRAGAEIYHKAIKQYSFGEIIQSVADVVIERCNILAGLAIVENARDETALIEAVQPKEFRSREPQLLELARQWMPRLPFPRADLLIVDEIGKDISGSGMDTNIIGRKFNDHVSTERDDANCTRIFVRSLTQASAGNALGIGIAEFTNRRTVEQIDWEKTRMNCITSEHPTGGMIPMTYDTDREAIEAALSTIGMIPPDEARVMQITNTLRLEEVLVSEAYHKEIDGRAELSMVAAPAELEFNSTGNLRPVRNPVRNDES